MDCVEKIANINFCEMGNRRIHEHFAGELLRRIKFMGLIP